ncbi:MAG: DEAD/DEAH box helicase [Candidatus Omnitrophica bacterium]|nr:DEAD/DEAH box helicase [Candidatus Omnitrophota bacterium]
MSDYIGQVFGNLGPIAKAMSNYETRPEQIKMARAVEAAILNSETLIVEAGTGVGKSFSYLIPIFKHTSETASIAVISTNTINLQEQIVHKDIPFLEKAMGQEFNAVLVKGRHNYLCLRRLNRSNLKQKDLFADEYEMRHFAKIVAWSHQTPDGSLYDLSEAPDPKVWDMVSANAENCLGKKCPYRKECFFQKARDAIRDARILVVNHHLFFSNMAMEEDQKSILPQYDALVFDEAHSVENVATEHLGAAISNSGVKYLMELLFNPKKEKGFLLSIGDQESMEWVTLIQKISETFFKRVERYFEKHRPGRESDSMRIRKSDFIENDLAVPFSRLVESLLNAKKRANNKEDELELSAYIKKLNKFNESLGVILSQDIDGYVYWIESSGAKRTKISLNAAPVSIGAILKEGLFSEPRPVILTSATLSVENGNSPFGYFRERMGLSTANELKLGSSFNYKEQVKLYIAQNMPKPGNLREYAAAVSERIKKYLTFTNGSAFVLFTSYSLMNTVYEELEDYLLEKGYNTLKQGSALGRSKMLSSFKKQEGSVLFGVDSFWQGIDVQGKALSNVIITKLPFSVPDHPVTEARTEAIEKRGGDAFLEYSLPEAVLKFKQGFGRLIRSKKDTGMVAVLDSRILNKSYGAQFLNSIPKCETIIDP